jgi:cell fate (sporulation/competence/biofilm development) regulator YlbF (YheA/YmcA/DUF963 family)
MFDDWDDSIELMGAATKLADALKESRLYAAYRKSRIQLERHPEVAARLKQFKQMHREYEARESPGFDEEKAISHQYTVLTRHPAAAAFLEREQALLKVYGQVADLIDEAWDMDLFE